ncbi:hypothetical protein E2C01_088896 [Portunus trituberculatus]|uniref:Uncharacterized protein n=1 Tax=Portunus trituberculatus TaxID=210409 RepID=A0A5B7JGP7_PORTR|nr:hypothetical protein [Portunus trituberculatus]
MAKVFTISIPHVREYGVEEMDRCVAVRAAKGTSTWITFVGDSNQRQKLHSLFAFMPEDLTYSYYLGNEQVRGKAAV